MLGILKKIIPRQIFEFFQPTYHYLLALVGALLYSFPSRKLIVVGVTVTKGKSTTTELINSILESAGYKTALQNTVRFKIGEKESRNMYKMSMPGRFFMQNFLSDAVKAGCSHAVLELTSEGAKQFRHKFIDVDALIFTNLAPEHIESHGSYEKYVEAKLSIARELEAGKQKKFIEKVWPSSSSENRGLFKETFSAYPALIINKDDKEAERFLNLKVKNKITYSLSDAFNMHTSDSGSSFQIDKTVIHSSLPGEFNVYNMLGAIACAKFLGISEEAIKKGLENVHTVRGRMEKIELAVNPLRQLADGGFDVVVDYAHTPDSLKAVYETYKETYIIAVLGNTGGGRDKWKRPMMAKIADDYCREIILTNEDPYDEDPKQILEDMKKGVLKNKPEIIMDRRKAIRTAIKSALAKTKLNKEIKVAVLITGKGTDPYICGPNGTKEPWDDATVAREELQKVLKL